MTVRHRRKLLAELNLRFEGNGDFSYETQVESQESLHSSDIMISDWSGTAIEYAFGLERPVIFIDLPRKINNSEYGEISIEPFEVTIRSKIGSVISSSRLEDIPKHIEELCSNPGSFKQEIRKIRSESVYNVGTSGAVGAAHIAQTVEKLRGTCEKKRWAGNLFLPYLVSFLMTPTVYLVPGIKFNISLMDMHWSSQL